MKQIFLVGLKVNISYDLLERNYLMDGKYIKVILMNMPFQIIVYI